MQLALYCPDYGFYEKEGDTIGRRGNFFTSVSVGALFGELLAFEFSEWLTAQHAPDSPFKIAEAGAHDENISFERMEALVGKELAAKVREVSMRLYREAADYARERGIIIADTKFEFGTDDKGNLVLIDEALTADSSRFWPADQYRPGTSPPSFDKQYVRDYLETLDWKKKPPAPPLPPEVIAKTSEKYREALYRLTGQRLGG